MKTISVIIPLYNEEFRLEKTLEQLEQDYSLLTDIEIDKIVFVNDGSIDSTHNILRKFKHTIQTKNTSFPQVIIVSYTTNHGRGYAVRQGMKHVSGDYGMYLDGDLSIPLTNLNTFSKYIEMYDVLLGSKKHPKTITLVRRSHLREYIGSTHSKLLQQVLGGNFYDYTGGFKVFSKEFCTSVFPFLSQQRWGLDPEVIYVAHKLGYRIKELPITWSHISTSSKVNLLRDSLRALKEMAVIRIHYSRSPLLLQKVSLTVSIK